MTKNKILVTGAAGYIGGTFTYEVLKKGFEVYGIDNFINSGLVPTIVIIFIISGIL